MKLSEGLRRGLAIREKIGRPYCAAVIVAAGTSSRMGGTNKILTVLENLPVICRTVDVFDKCAMIDEIIVVTQRELLEKVSRYLKAYDKMRMVVAGGETRTDSVMAGLAAVSDRTQLVAVHDGARPLVTDEVICRTVSKAKKFAAAAPAVRVKDTIKVSTSGGRRNARPQNALRCPDPAGLQPRSACRGPAERQGAGDRAHRRLQRCRSTRHARAADRRR